MERNQLRGRGRDDDDTPRRGRGRDDDDDAPRGRGRGRDDDDAPRRGSRDDDAPRGRGRDDDDSPRRGRGRDDDDAPRRGGREGGRGSSGYQYQPRSAETTRARADKGANDYDKILKDHIKMWKPNDGVNRIRILPPTWPKAEHFGYDIYVHYGVGPDRQSYLCLQKMLDKPDPIHEEREKARRELDPENKEDAAYIKDLEAKRRVLWYIIDRDNEREGVQAWAAPWTIDRDVVKVSVDKSSGEVLQIDHPEEGFDVSFEKKGSGARTEYLGVSIARRSTPLGKDAWLEYAVENPLPDQLHYYDYDHIAKAFGAKGEHRDAGRSRDDDAPRGRGRDDDDDRPRGRGRDDEDPPARGRDAPRIPDEDRPDRGRDVAPARGRGREEPELSWDSIHSMTSRELMALIEDKDLDIDPRESKDDEDLADWVCEELKVKKETRRASAPPDDDVEERLRKMRERRGDR